MRVNMHQAKTELSKLVEAAERGEEVIISRHGEPTVRLVPVQQKKIQLGALAGKVKIPKDDGWWRPMTDEQLDRFLGGKVG